MVLNARALFQRIVKNRVDDSRMNTFIICSNLIALIIFESADSDNRVGFFCMLRTLVARYSRLV